ncbi:MAG TPA: hypothetical protein VK675_04810, partial [Candidatus Paceibacterota bacterium]|nr:hypothetical protein [Candidatus Paceibacterota bacterium]
MKENLKIVYLLFGVVLVLTAVALLWIPLLLHYGNQKVKVSPVAKTLTTSPVVSTNSDEAKILFFTNNIFPIVKHIRSEQWGIKALNTRHSELAGAILKRYGKPYNVEIGINYGKGETNMESMLALCYLQTDGSPAVRLYVPTAMWLFGNLSRSGNTNWQEQFVYAITIAYFHEMDH